MAKYFLGLGFIFTSFFSFSQNFATVYPDKEGIYLKYSYPYSYFILKADSAKTIGADTIYYHFNILRDNSSSTCWLKKLPNWTGSKTIIKPKGENIFLTDKGDSIRIRTNSQLNEKWHLYDFPNGNYFEAELTSTVLGSVLTVTDSLKFITLTLKDNLGVGVSHDFNGRQIVLSKNYGMLKAYDFYLFPNDTSALILSGISNPKIGVQDITAKDIFDYNVGDEFHIESGDISGQYYGSESKWRIIVLTKNISLNQDTLIYQIENTAFIHDVRSPYPSSLVTDTVTDKIILSQYQQLNMTSSKLYKINDDYGGYSYFYNDLSSGVKTFITPGSSDDSCFFLGEFSGETYIEGLGGTYYDIQGPLPERHYRNLLYYKKGTETYGTPIDFNILLSIQNQNQAHISYSLAPNPFSDYTVLSIINGNNQNYQLTLLDMCGKVVHQYSFNDDQFILHSDGNLKGLYIYKLVNDKNEVAVGKLIIY